MPITRIEPQRLYRQIADQISDLIASGEFPQGSRLPSERRLAVQLGVSRPSLREAMIALEIAGAVTVQTGSGIYVRAVAPLAADPGPGPLEVFAARRLIEAEVAALAAKTALPADLDQLDRGIAQMRSESSHTLTHEDGDRVFHLALAEATHNSALVLVVQTLWDLVSSPMWIKLRERMRNAALRPRLIDDHVAIRDAVAAGDAPAARRAMIYHLRESEQALTDVWRAGQSTPGTLVSGVITTSKRQRGGR
ncbi:MAG TPA: FadR/GntR family transcriptional regulator [Stellaceae bacterium]|nr:FadR/GntR family transcriptional regulator [Stellaceae bacterium]